MIHPETEASPMSRAMKAMTDPAAVTTNTWAMTLSLGRESVSEKHHREAQVVPYAKFVTKTTIWASC